MSIPMDSMYREIIVDHYKHPQHRGLLDDFDAEIHHVNPTCGDEVTLRLRVADGTVKDVGWVGEALAMQEKFLRLMQSQGQAELSGEEADELGDAVAFEGVSKYPARVKCALLGWMAMKGAVAATQEGN